MSTFKERYEERKKNRKSQETTSSFKDRYLARQIESGKFDSNEITSRIDTWFKNHNNYINNYNSRYSTRKGTYEDSYVSDSGEWLDTISAQKSNFDKEASAIVSYLDQYGDYFGKEYTDSVKNAFQSALGQQSEILKQASNDKHFWSQFADENEYIDFQREAKKQKRYEGYAEKYAGMSYEDILAASNRLMGDEEREWIDANKYSLIPEADDFAENSNYRSTYRGGEKFNAWSGTYTDSGFDDIAYDYINRNETAKKRQGLSDLQSKASFLGLDNSERGEMTDDEIATFNYLYATRSPEEAYAYIDYLTSDLNARQRETEAAKWAKYANESPVGASVLSVIESPLKGISYVGQIADYAADGKIDENAGYNKFSHINSAIRNEVTKKVEEKWGGVGSFAYQTGMSMGDFLFNTAVTGGNSALSLALMGSGAAADTVISSKDRGLNDNQAFLLGTIAGAAEIITEKFSIGALLDATKLGKSAVGYIVNNALTEGLEEVGSSFINLMADILVAKDKSAWQAAIDAYKDDGMSDSAAFWHAVGDQALSLGLDFLGGAISGGLMGGGGAIVGAVGNTVQGKEYKNTYGADIGSALAGEAVELSPNSGFAQRMQTKAEASKELSNRQVGKLLQQNENAMRENDVQTIKTGAANRLTELGETGDIDVIASALAKQVAGEKLKQSERNALKKSTQGQVVAQELDEENIKNGYSGTEWAQKLGTDRINANVYGRMVAELDTKDSSATVSEPEKVGETSATLKVDGKDVGVKVKEISSVKDGKITVKLDNGEVVDASKVNFGNEDTALVYQAAAEMSQRAGYNEDTVKVLVNGFESSGLNAAEYLHAFRDSFNYGAAGTVSVSALEKGKYTSLLSEKQRELAFHLGKVFGEESAQRAEQERARIENEKTASAEKEAKAVKASGEVIFDGSVNQGSLSKAQKAQIKVLRGVSSAIGAKIRLFASEATVTEDGRRTRVFSSADGEAITANGWYDNETGEIWIDVNAGIDGNGLILFTAAHELTHFIKDWSSEKYNAFANFLISQYAENGVSVDELIEAQIEKAAKRGREMTREEAFDEVVADSCESFLTDSNAAEKIAALNEKDATLAEKIKSYIHKLLVKIRNLLKGIDPDSEEGKIVRGMTDSLEQLYELWTDALADAGRSYQAAGVAIDSSTDGYWKLLIDFKMYDNDGVGVPQRAVTPDFSMNEAMAMLDEYKGGHQSYPIAHGVVDKFVEGYKEKGKQYSERYQAAEANADILALAEKVESGNFKANDKVYLGVVSEKLAKKIESLTGINVAGFKIAIEARQMVHILKDHGKNGKADRSMADLSDIAKMEYTLNNYDNINAAGRTLAYSYMVNGKNRTAPTVLYEKAIGEKSYYVVQAVPETKTKTLFIVTAFIGKSGYKKEVSQLINAKSPDATSEFGSATTSGSIISHPEESVNSKSKKMSERDPDAISSREVLANALESTVQNDIEAERLAEYKSKIEKFDAEEQKLRQLRAEIKELSFAPGKRDNARLAELRAEAEKTANRINIYDKQLLRLEASKPLEGILQREKQKAYKRAEAKGRAALDEYRARAQKSQEELKARYQESKRRGIEGRHKTEVRHKIQGIVSELNTLLLNPTAKKHIKEELRRGVAEALSAFNMDTVGAEERLAEINRKLQKETDPYEIEHLLESYRRIQNQGANLQEKLEKLNTAYEKIKDSDDIELNLAYQEVIQNSIKAVSEKVGDTSIRDMTLEQLEMVYDLFKMIRHTIRDANKAFKTKKGETITQMADKVNHEVRTVGGQPYQRNAVSATLQRIGWTFLKPYFAFRTIGSETLVDRYRELREGEDTFYSDIREAQTFIEEQYEKYGFKSWDMKETREFKAKSGKSFELTLEQMMTLYAYSKREQAHAHIMEGGIVFEDALVVKKNKLGVPVKYEVTTKDAFNLSEEIFADIANALTDKQKAYVDAMQAYLSDNMGAKGNEVSMQLVGVKLFKEKFYLPIKSSQYYMNFKSEEAGEVKLRSPAFSKETVKHANNPIVLHNFTDLWAEHINDMAMYHAFVLALEDFTRVYNYKTKTGADTETMDTKATLETAYPGVTKYINKFLKDMNGGIRGETVGWAEKMTSLAKKGSVLGSASVTIQQPSAIMRAMAYINPKYFVGEKVSEGKHKQKWEELKKYAPIAGIKEMGRFDVGMGQSTSDWIKADKNILEKAEEVISLPPAKMDEVTWLAIWNAVKRETAHNYPKLETSSEEFLTLAGERFTDVISLSQVYDSVFSRSDIMRNKSWIAKSLTAFMAEPTTTLNMLWDSAVQGKRTGSAKGFVATTASTGGAVFAAIFVNSLLKSFVMAMRDDDEDESYAEKYLEHFVGDLKDNLNPLNLIPFVKDIVSIFKGYDVERMDMALFSDLKNAIDAFDSDSKTLYEKWSGFIGAASAFFGIPIKNIERDVRALFNTFFGKREETTLEGMLYAIEKSWSGEQKSKGQQLYEAMLKGDEKHIERLRARFDSPSDISVAIKKGLRENDVRIKAAARMLNSGDIRGFAGSIETISGEGIFDGETVEAAIRAEASAFNSKIKDAAEAKRDGKTDDYIKIVKELRESYRGVYTQDEIVEAVNSYTFEDIVEDYVEEVESVYKNSDINAALESGDTETASEIIKELIEVKTENNFLKAQREAEESGKRFKEKEARTRAELEARSSIRSSLTNYWKKRYIAAYESGNEAEINRISELLYSTGIYGNRKKYLNEVLEGWLEK